jgi:two-component system response regulator ResD
LWYSYSSGVGRIELLAEAVVDKCEVLVIDDNKTTRDILKMMLGDERFIVSSCASGPSALDLAKEKQFEIFVVDYSMPEMKGNVVTQELRKLWPDSFIIGYSIELKEEVFLAAGADKFIIKDHLDKELIPLIKERKHLGHPACL